MKYKLIKKFKPGYWAEKYIFENGLLYNINYKIIETKSSVKIYKAI